MDVIEDKKVFVRLSQLNSAGWNQNLKVKLHLYNSITFRAYRNMIHS